MKMVLGIMLCLAGIVAGLYVGVYVCLVGGITQIIDGVRADPVSAAAVAWGIALIIFAGLAGSVSAVVFIVPGIGCLKVWANYG